MDNTRIFKSKSTGETFQLKITGDNRAEIDLENPISPNMKDYKSVGGNNAFDIFELTNKAYFARTKTKRNV